MEQEQLLARGLAALDFDISSGILDKLLYYIDELERWNPVYGFVKAEGQDLIIKHVLDSLGPWRILEDLFIEMDKQFSDNNKLRITDIGTGAGFPGLPLAIAFPQRSFLLIERLEKRVRFLENVICILGLENVEIHQNTVEEEDEPLGCVIFRALRPFTDKKLFRTIWKKIQLGGALCAYKGRIMHAKLELTELLDDPVLSSMAAHAKITPVWVPFLEEERCLVVARKTLNI